MQSDKGQVEALGDRLHCIDLMSHLPSSLRGGLRCFSFDRLGGVSPAPFDSLNVGEAVGDLHENVGKNRQIIKRFAQVRDILFIEQVHGVDILHVDAIQALLPGEIVSGSKADGIVSRVPGLGLMIKHADCQAVVMFDPVKRVVANIHCGWRGSVHGILSKAVCRLWDRYGSRPGDIWAGISPSLGPCCGEFRGWKNILPEWMHSFQVRPDHFDFWAISIQQLIEAGLDRNHIFCPRICTVCDSNYFSYRRDRITGRQATLIALSE